MVNRDPYRSDERSRYPGRRDDANERPGRRGAGTRGPRPADRISERISGDDENWNDYGGTGVRYGGSSSGGYGTGGAALDYRDVVGSRYDWEHRYADVRQVFPEEGRHRGRGPRNYTRSDQRIREDVSDWLTDDPHIDASDIEVTVESGEVTLSGTVMSRPVKHRAEDIAESVSGVRQVQNNLRIQSKAGVLMGARRSTGTPDSSTGGEGNTPTMF
ncbi:BON domain-containing protein [Sinorhizobium numidicum]|uniref:BON domain-containing protein n=1 Tax=Sinorhizobium numidicum TaxID=680248 RepID=A0ABY8CNX0_9HYPH|nr:BON domain-containing protein [Sinorhizobium numidicum]WEX74353.1 BON domain-containing protein [Sinorhizobium numidicum]WEX80340.1 BON domain-containing protein [Sinorhizobium numidicum]